MLLVNGGEAEGEVQGEAKYLEVETTRGGGEDIWSAKSEAAKQGQFLEHLIIMVNGLVGR